MDERTQYEVRLRGILGETLLGAFPELRADARGDETVLTGSLPDQAALHGVLARIEALGIAQLGRCRLTRSQPTLPAPNQA